MHYLDSNKDNNENEGLKIINERTNDETMIKDIDPITGKEILINKKTGEKINNSDNKNNKNIDKEKKSN